MAANYRKDQNMAGKDHLAGDGVCVSQQGHNPTFYWCQLRDAAGYSSQLCIVTQNVRFEQYKVKMYS